ncbi:hypothetical protein [Rhodococcus sp. BUPNP1]|uniref:hypothetical protein n=1 Tax=Rhodococcus sp. BUPNP1 TaxID=1432786 RepID=UPI00117A28DD|nr:hypothetical protein [Rhodococcus sp. BUPNP1]
MQKALFGRAGFSTCLIPGSTDDPVVAPGLGCGEIGQRTQAMDGGFRRSKDLDLDRGVHGATFFQIGASTWSAASAPPVRTSSAVIRSQPTVLVRPLRRRCAAADEPAGTCSQGSPPRGELLEIEKVHKLAARLSDRHNMDNRDYPSNVEGVMVAGGL